MADHRLPPAQGAGRERLNHGLTRGAVSCRACASIRTDHRASCLDPRQRRPADLHRRAAGGLARDGGLYIPQEWPQISRETIAGLAGRPYAEAAKTVLSPLVDGEIAASDFGRMIDESYATFRHPAVCPLTQLGDNLFLLELHHGPTLAFKDVAMQLLGRLMDHALKAKGSRATIVGATSGDTAAPPSRRSAARQRRRVHPLPPWPGVRGPAPADDHGRCGQHPRARRRGHLRRLPGDREGAVPAPALRRGRAALGRQLDQLGPGRRAGGLLLHQRVALGSPHRPVSFSVPTGNFGDILAGWAAKRMGLPVGRLMIATNANDILARTLATGSYEVRGVARPPPRRRWTSRSRRTSSACCSSASTAMPAPSTG